MKNSMRAVLVVAAAVSLTLASGCTESKEPQSGPGTPGTLEKVKYVTGAGVQGRESYIYVAIEKGFFRDAGLDVEVVPGNGTTANLQILQGGQAEFVTVDITAAFIEYGKGTFTDFTVVSAIQQRNLACFMAIEGQGISSPKDLEGKKIAFIPGGVVKLLFDAYADLAGINASSVQWVTVPVPQMGPALASGSIDAATQFVVGQPSLEAASGGKKVVVLPFSDYLTDLYGVGLAVTRQAIAENPDRVRRFNEAMLKGLQYAEEHPDEAGEIYSKYQQLQPKAVAAAEVKLMKPYVVPGGDAPIGTIDPLRAARNIAILQSVGQIPASFDADKVISFDFVPKS